MRITFGGKRRAISSAGKQNTGCGVAFLVLFSLPFIGAGAAAAFFLGVRPMYSWLDAQGWRETPCEITQSRIDTNSSSDGSTYKVHIEFVYEWDGRQYGSDAYNFNTWSSSGRSGKQKVVNKYPIGTQTICFVNPDDPTRAVLSRDFSIFYVFGIILGGIFMGVGLVVLYAGVFGKANEKSLSQGGRRLFERKRRPLMDGLSPTDPLLLKPRHGPIGKLLGMLLVALFWNGIVSVFLVQIVQGWRSGNPEIFMTLFMIPFVLIGLAMIFGVFYFLLAMFNPRPSLILTPGGLALGSTASLKWLLSGSVQRVSRFVIWLEGREAATYTVGTNTHTAHNTFERIPLVNTENHADMRMGEGEIQMPEFSMRQTIRFSAS